MDVPAPTTEPGEGASLRCCEASLMFDETVWATGIEATAGAAVPMRLSEAEMGEFEQPPAELI